MNRDYHCRGAPAADALERCSTRNWRCWGLGRAAGELQKILHSHAM
jgi:hypothetical protein